YVFSRVKECTLLQCFTYGCVGEETVGLISRLLDSKLDKKFADFKRALEQEELSTNSQIKK
ncbi:unnamed protein product, partial [Porites evermanni]